MADQSMSGANGSTKPTPESNEAGPSEQRTTDKGKGPALPDKAKNVLKDKLEDQKDKIDDTKGKIISKTKKPPGGFDRTPFPDAPQGYTVRIMFCKATNLPAADLGTRSSDPYIHATLTSKVPKRHKEDPDLTHRTRTMRRTTDPEWNDIWIVANVPYSGFTLKCRLYDEDWPDHDDRLGNLTYVTPRINEKWAGLGPNGRTFKVKKHMGSKRAYLVKGIASMFKKGVSMTPSLTIIIDVLGKSDPPHAQIHTVGPTTWTKHYSPMIGRLTGVKVNKDQEKDANAPAQQSGSRLQKYDFQANQMQLAGPVPPSLYHRYVEFRPVIGLIFASTGLRGRILNKALHKQHARIYNYDSTTETDRFEACTEAASMQFLRMLHFDHDGGRVFTYVLTLDGVLRFTETGPELGIDLLSKHTMHSDVATYIACSGEFFIRRAEDPNPQKPTAPSDPRHYQLVIDNDSGTYRPDKSVLPDLVAFLTRNFPGLGIVAMHWEDEELQALKANQASVKKKQGRAVPLVMMRSPSTSSFGSDASRLAKLEGTAKSKKERALDALQHPGKIRSLIHGGSDERQDDAVDMGGEGSNKGKSKDPKGKEKAVVGSVLSEAVEDEKRRVEQERMSEWAAKFVAENKAKRRAARDPREEYEKRRDQAIMKACERHALRSQYFT